MKYIFLFTLFIAVNFAANCQLVDSSFITSRNGIFFQNRKVVDELGKEISTISPIGDSTKLFDFINSQLNSDLFEYGVFVSQVIPIRKAITEKSRYLRQIGTIGFRILDSLAKEEPDLYKIGYWQLNGTPIRFRRTASNFQYRADTSATWREMTYLGSVIRLNNLNGYTTDLFKTGNNQRYRNINNQYNLRPVTDNGSSRNVSAPPPTEPEEIPPTLNPDGTVTISGTTMKYNSRKKKWEPNK